MASFLYTLEGFSVGGDQVAHAYNNDTGLWSVPTAFTGPTTIASPSNFRQEGGWDGSFWYVIGSDGKLYRYNPTAATWSSALNGGVAVITGTVEDTPWYMESDGRFMYIYSAGGFKRYDPVADSIVALTDLGAGSFGNMGWMIYDGVDILYINRGANANANFQSYTLSTASWATLATVPGPSNFQRWAAYLGGKFILLNCISPGGGGTGAFSFDPGTGLWTTKATSVLPAGVDVNTIGGEINDTTLRIWNSSNGGLSSDYNMISDTWSSGPAITWATTQGANFVVARLFTPGYTFYESDGVTPLTPTKNLQAVAVGGTLQAQIKVKTAVARAGGAAVSVPALTLTDAENAVTICATAGGTYGTSFTTAALLPNQLFDVFIKITPTVVQTLGLSKLWNLRVV